MPRDRAPAPRAWSRATAVAVVAAFALILVACAPQHATGPKVLLIGDSILNASRQEILATLRDAGWDPVVHADGGTTIPFWSTRVGFYELADEPDIVVFELGTNGCFPNRCVPLGPYIDTIMRSIPSSRPVLWLNVQEDVPTPFNEKVDWVNRAIEDAGVRWPNLTIVDFNDHFAGHPEWHSPDGLHPNEQGAQELARFIAAELEPFKPER